MEEVTATDVNRILKGSIKELNLLWKWSREHSVPFIVVTIEGRSKYATLEYDMYPVSYNLNPKTVKRIEELYDRLVGENSETGRAHKQTLRIVGESTGMVSDILKEIAIGALAELKTIVFDKTNWEWFDSEYPEEMVACRL